jgi:hypothetical protein
MAMPGLVGDPHVKYIRLSQDNQIWGLSIYIITEKTN